MKIFNYPSSFPCSKVPGGMQKNAFFRGCNIFVAMVTMYDCSWRKAVLTNMINVSQETIASSRNFTSVKIKLTVNYQSHN